jgi:hypothetical protein
MKSPARLRRWSTISQKTVELRRIALKDAGLSAAEINVCAGGGMRAESARAVKQLFGKEPHKASILIGRGRCRDPGGRPAGRRQDVLLLDVTRLLGTETLGACSRG